MSTLVCWEKCPLFLRCKWTTEFCPKELSYCERFLLRKRLRIPSHTELNSSLGDFCFGVLFSGLDLVFVVDPSKSLVTSGFKICLEWFDHKETTLSRAEIQSHPTTSLIHASHTQRWFILSKAIVIIMIVHLLNKALKKCDAQNVKLDFFFLPSIKNGSGKNISIFHCVCIVYTTVKWDLIENSNLRHVMTHNNARCEHWLDHLVLMPKVIAGL